MQYQFTIIWIAYGKPQQVYEALTQATAIEKWSGQNASFDTNKNTFQWFNGWVSGTIEKLLPNTEIRLTWKPNIWNKKTAHSNVVLLLEPDIAGTKITITHSNLPNETESNNHKNGWVDMVLDPLNDYLIA